MRSGNNKGPAWVYRTERVMHGLRKTGRERVRTDKTLPTAEVESARPRQAAGENATLVPLLSVRGLDTSDDLHAVQHQGYVRLPGSGVIAYLDVPDR